MALAGARDARERVQIPSLGKVCGDGILNAMYSRMNVIAAFQPWRELWVRTTAAQIGDEIARDCHGAGLVRGLMNVRDFPVALKALICALMLAKCLPESVQFGGGFSTPAMDAGK